MAAIAATRAAVEPHVAAVPGVVLANLNHPTQIVASGTTAGIDALIARLAAAGIAAKRLPVSHAFHSPLMAGAAGPLAALAGWHPARRAVGAGDLVHRAGAVSRRRPTRCAR